MVAKLEEIRTTPVVNATLQSDQTLENPLKTRTSHRLWVNYRHSLSPQHFAVF